MRKSGIRSISEKRKAQLKAKGPTRRAWINRTTKGAKRKGRKSSEFARIYGSRARVAFVKAMPCLSCQQGPSDNAHTQNGGMGRKANYDTIVPLCRPCHTAYDERRFPFGEYDMRLFIEHYAAVVEQTWQAHTLSRTLE